MCVQEREQAERTALRNAQAESQKLNRELNEEMPTNISGFVDAKKVGIYRSSEGFVVLNGPRCTGSGR